MRCGCDRDGESDARDGRVKIFLSGCDMHYPHGYGQSFFFRKNCCPFRKVYFQYPLFCSECPLFWFQDPVSSSIPIFIIIIIVLTLLSPPLLHPVPVLLVQAHQTQLFSHPDIDNVIIFRLFHLPHPHHIQTLPA